MSVEIFKKKNLVRTNSLAVLPTTLFSGYAFARGGHGGSADIPDWISFLVLGAIATFLLVSSATSSFKNWKDGQYFKSIASSAFFLSLVWLIYFLIEWEAVWRWIGSLALFIGITGGSLIGIVAAVFIVGFVLKSLLALFFKEFENIPTEDFLEGIALLVGSVISFVVMYAFMALFFIGIPAFIVIKVLELAR